MEGGGGGGFNVRVMVVPFGLEKTVNEPDDTYSKHMIP